MFEEFNQFDSFNWYNKRYQTVVGWAWRRVLCLKVFHCESAGKVNAPSLLWSNCEYMYIVI